MTGFALPLAVLVAVILWPERIPKDRTVEAIRARIESEHRSPELVVSLRGTLNLRQVCWRISGHDLRTRTGGGQCPAAYLPV
ncbi:hypothetical protein [Nocardia sp. NBC_01009]|uniref:hypothetical protein n=1 Tax=Nocardia sp. NBC_01009 TaxID=2975996 RepID=UPI00386AB7C4|nr:hypothetical protein OHA42_14885 [Nocardia sp. NBC_01009]